MSLTRKALTDVFMQVKLWQKNVKGFKIILTVVLCN